MICCERFFPFRFDYSITDAFSRSFFVRRVCLTRKLATILIIICSINIIASWFVIYAIMFSKYFHRSSSIFSGGDFTAVQTSVYGIPAWWTGTRLPPPLSPSGHHSDIDHRQYLATAELSVYYHRLFHARRTGPFPAAVVDPVVPAGCIDANLAVAAAD